MDPSAAATHGKHIYNNEMIGSSRRHARTLPPNEEEYEANKVLNNTIDLPENQRTHYIYNRSIINVHTHNQLARIIYLWSLYVLQDRKPPPACEVYPTS